LILPGIDPRNAERYRKLVTEHVNAARSTAAGAADGMAAAKAAYRFFKNKNISLPALARPLQMAAEEHVAKQGPSAVLVVHDASALKYPDHHAKKDQTRLSNHDDIGYELVTALAVDGGTGDPIAPLHARLRAADGVHSTRTPAPGRNSFWVDDLGKTMTACADMKLGGTVVHVVDREADSLAHYREWDAAGRTFLVRADDDRIVDYEGQECKLPELAAAMDEAGDFEPVGPASRLGRPCTLEVAEVQVTLRRPAWRHRSYKGKKKKERVAGPPLPLRLVVARLRGEDGAVEAQWLLFTNASIAFAAATIALWYYFRWRIESFFKLLKSAGMELEQWQQETALRIARRLLVACMACVVVWRLQRANTPAEIALRDMAMQLSGRLTKPDVPYTAPALLIGLWRLLGALLLLETHSADELLELGETLRRILPQTVAERLDSS